MLAGAKLTPERARMGHLRAMIVVHAQERLANGMLVSLQSERSAELRHGLLQEARSQGGKSSQRHDICASVPGLGAGVRSWDGFLKWKVRT